MKPVLTQKEIIDSFVNAKLIENYNFLQEDLDKLAHAFVETARKKIMLEELEKAVEVSKAYNPLVAEKLKQVRIFQIKEELEEK